MGFIVGILLVWVLWEACWITVWVKGLQSKTGAMVIFGSLFSLGIIGIIIGIVQTTSWNSTNNSIANINASQENLKLEREKFEFEKQKYNENKDI